PRGVAVVARGGLVLDQRMRRASDDPALLGEEDVAVAAQRCIARPLVPRQRDEAARLVELGGEPVELLPELVCDLEVVALVGAGVHERPIACECEVLAGAPGADRLLRLTVEIAPV